MGLTSCTEVGKLKKMGLTSCIEVGKCRDGSELRLAKYKKVTWKSDLADVREQAAEESRGRVKWRRGVPDTPATFTHRKSFDNFKKMTIPKPTQQDQRQRNVIENRPQV
jgi:hypothetical protein